VGKSASAIKLAQALNGEVINLDSVQVYRELEIGSAKPSTAQRSVVPHHLFDCANITEHFDVGQYRLLAVKKISEVIARGKIPIFCGGSSMYLTVLLHGLMQQADTNSAASFKPDSRPHLSTAELYCDLQQGDPLRAQQIHPNDRQRISRALDLLAQGVLPSSLARAHGFPQSEFTALILVKTLSRANLYQRINERAAQMVKDGIIEEARTLCEKFGRVRILDSLGYKQVLDWDGNSQDFLTAAIATATRQYAKRQTTFWRNEPVKRAWRAVTEEAQNSPSPSLDFSEVALKTAQAWLTDISQTGSPHLMRYEQP